MLHFLSIEISWAYCLQHIVWKPEGLMVQIWLKSIEIKLPCLDCSFESTNEKRLHDFDITYYIMYYPKIDIDK